MSNLEAPADSDVLIIGAGPAGSTLAGLLAKEGHRVTVLEREHFPRYHVGESLITGIIPVLDELGVRGKMDALGFPKKEGITLVWGNDPEPWSAKFTQTGVFDYSWNVPREEFDAMLADRARELGATIVHGAHVVSPLLDELGGVTGLAWRDEAGSDRVTRARYTVDASGQARVLVRKLTTLRGEEDLDSVAVWSYYSPFERLPGEERDHIVVEAVPDGWLWGIPVTAAKMSVGLVIQKDAFVAQSRTASRDEIFEGRLAHTRLLHDLVKGGTREQDLRVTRDWSYQSDAFQGRGWLAVGDCAVFIDPLFSSGAWLATSGAWLAARALHAALESGSPEVAREAIASFEQIYRQIAKDILAFVRYFYDPRRSKEDYLEKATSIVQMISEGSEVGFISLISGVNALPDVLDFNPMGWDSPRISTFGVGGPTGAEA